MDIWKIIESVTYTKKDLSDDIDFKSTYNQWMINKALSMSFDTILYAQEMNMISIDNDMHYSTLINNIRPMKRYAKWPKKKNEDSVDLVKEYYGYNSDKARSVVDLLSSDQIKIIKKRLEKGGVK